MNFETFVRVVLTTCIYVVVVVSKFNSLAMMSAKGKLMFAIFLSLVFPLHH